MTRETHVLSNPEGGAELLMVSEENDLFIYRNGRPIAKRGHPGTPQARTWISLEPGWEVLDSDDGDSISLTYRGASIN
jgi:hypothetical protein